VAVLTSDPEARADTDAVDAALAASGDVHAFERLYHGHIARIHSLARRMLGPEDADEGTQDVFVRVWEKLGTFRGESAFGTWLHRLAINVMLGRRATRGRMGERFVGDAPLERAASRRKTPELAMDFETAIGRLPPGAREVFVLHDIEGFKHHEIAELLGVAPGTSKAQLHRARMSLRRQLA
jgi:RNA polymerase sigma-70 factor (ECF subfamily)